MAYNSVSSTRTAYTMERDAAERAGPEADGCAKAHRLGAATLLREHLRGRVSR